MSLFTNKFFKRFFLILSNALKQISAQAINIVISIIIIHQYSKALWGSFTAFIIYTAIISIICNWGNKEYLLRAFSKRPSQISQLFYEVLHVRWILILVSIIITFIIYPGLVAFHISLWIFALFITQSLEVFLNYKRNFGNAMLIEFILFGLLILWLYQFKISHVGDLIKYYAYYQMLRALMYIILYYNDIKKPTFSVKKNYYKEAGIFFILGLVGFLQSRADFLLYSYFETAENIGIYQVLNAYFILIHAIGTFLIFPFIKNIYRLNENAVEKLQQKIIFTAPLIVILALISLYILNVFVYHFELPITLYIIGFAIAYPPYFYAVKIFQLYKYNQQNFVLYTGIMAIIINAIIATILLQFNFGFAGALTAAAGAQIFTAFRYHKISLNRQQIIKDN